MMIDQGPYLSTSRAIDKKIITGVMFPDQFEKYTKSLNDKKIKIIDSEDYNLLEDFVYDWAPSDKSKIAIIYAVGGIISGKSNPGPSGSSLMGDETISKAIKRAREDNDIKAIVFRIDSGGGSALASDMMWNEIRNTTTTDTENIKYQYPYEKISKDIIGAIVFDECHWMAAKTYFEMYILIYF